MVEGSLQGLGSGRVSGQAPVYTGHTLGTCPRVVSSSAAEYARYYVSVSNGLRYSDLRVMTLFTPGNPENASGIAVRTSQVIKSISDITACGLAEKQMLPRMRLALRGTTQPYPIAVSGNGRPMGGLRLRSTSDGDQSKAGLREKKTINNPSSLTNGHISNCNLYPRWI